MNHYIIIVSLIASLFLVNEIYAQQDCKVLYDAINTNYEGSCKKGLAHGKGIAKGEDTYEGNFKKGLPHGQGIYTYAEGDNYKGKWKEGERNGYGTYMDAQGGKYIGTWKSGLKHGEGSYYLKMDNRDTVLAGIWKDDKYVGPKPKKPYIITSRRSVDRVTMFRSGDGNRLTIKIMQSGAINSTVIDYRFIWSSGNQLPLGTHARGWENMEFPFEARITYTTSNKLRTSTYIVNVEFIINEPGEWELILHN